MKRAMALLAALAALAAQPAAAQAPVPPASDALVERYMAAIPQTRERNDAARGEGEVARLLELNPGHEADVRAAVDAWQTCFSPVLNASTDRVLRGVVRAMGEAKLTGLISFYTGPDHPVFGALVEASERGPLSAAQRAEQQRIFDTYPVLDFHRDFRAALQRERTSVAFRQAAERCAAIEADLLASRGLRRE